MEVVRKGRKWCVNKYLNLHGDFSTVFQHPMVHLADGRCSEWFLFEGQQLVSPTGPQVLLQNFLHSQIRKGDLKTICMNFI